ncbi:MAG: hypothetical protein Q8P91_00810 [bacterium]|nr:hypothetical protein [bacterium]
MNFFSKEETRAVLLILAVIIAFSYPNFIVSLRRARDAQRKADIGSIYSALNEFQSDFGSFPLPREGKIAFCSPFIKKETIVQPTKGLSISDYDYSACEWGKDSISDLFDPSFPPYLKIIPQDPHRSKGRDYFYLSNGNRYQIYGSLEGKGEDEYDEAIIKRNLPCGNKICNFGKGYSNIRLDISIEEYENIIRQ